MGVVFDKLLGLPLLHGHKEFLKLDQPATPQVTTGTFELNRVIGEMAKVQATQPSTKVGDLWLDTDEDPTYKFGDASDYTEFDASTGHQTMVGDARPWRDELADAINIKTSGIGVTVDPAEGTMVYVHNSAVTDYLYLNIQLNHDKDLTSKIYPHIHFFAAEQSVVPNFVVRYRWQTLGGTKVTSWTDYQCNTMMLPAPAAGVTNNNICGNSTGISVPAGTSLSDIVQFRVIRDHDGDTVFGGTDDPYTASVHVLAFDVHFMINSLGSDGEFSK